MKINACSNCGYAHPVVTHDSYCAGHGDYPQETYVFCPKCKFKGQVACDRDSPAWDRKEQREVAAIEMWNTGKRLTPPPHVARPYTQAEIDNCGSKGWPGIRKWFEGNSG